MGTYEFLRRKRIDRVLHVATRTDGLQSFGRENHTKMVSFRPFGSVRRPSG